MIAGAQKAATSSLKYYLGQHPDISTHLNLECDYFTSENDDFEKYFSEYFEPENKIILAKQAHLYKEEAYIQKLYEHNPNCKIIFVLREPIERLISAYEMEKKEWVNFSPDYFLEALSANKRGEYNVAYNTLIKLGDYGRAAKILYKYFPDKQIYFVSFSDLKECPSIVCENLFRILGVSSSFVPDVSKKNVAYANRSSVMAWILLWLKQSSLKKIIKYIVPYRYFLGLSKIIDKLNKIEASSSEKTVWGDKLISALKVHYKTTNLKFDQITGLKSDDLF